MNAAARITIPPVEPPMSSVLRMEIAPGFLATVDGTRVPDDAWGRRQKPRMVLAFAVAAGGRLDRRELVDALWPDLVTETDTARAFAVVLSVARKAIGAGSHAISVETGRALLLHANEVELVLGPSDSTDVGDLGLLLDRLGSATEPSAAELCDGARLLLPMMVRSPLSEFGRSILVQDLVDALMRDVAVASRLLIERWEERGADTAAPAEILAVAELACARDSTDEAIALSAIRLHATARGKAAASRIYHQFFMAMRSELGAAPSPRLADLHAAIMMGPK